MPRRPNPKCQECATHSIEWARLIHGPESEGGDGCWVEENDRCKKLRWQYQNRAEQTAKRRLDYHLHQQARQPADPTVSFPIPERATAIRIIFSEEPERFRKDVTLVHAVEFQLWVGTQCHARRQPIPCWGMRGDEVSNLMQQILEEFTKEFSLSLNRGRPFKKFLTIHKHIRDCELLSPWRLK